MRRYGRPSGRPRWPRPPRPRSAERLQIGAAAHVARERGGRDIGHVQALLALLDLIAEGLTNRQIGERLFLAEKKVKNYVSNMFTKLGMSRRAEAAAYAARLAERKSQEGRRD